MEPIPMPSTRAAFGRLWIDSLVAFAGNGCSKSHWPSANHYWRQTLVVDCAKIIEAIGASHSHLYRNKNSYVNRTCVSTQNSKPLGHSIISRGSLMSFIYWEISIPSRDLKHQGHLLTLPHSHTAYSTLLSRCTRICKIYTPITHIHAST